MKTQQIMPPSDFNQQMERFMREVILRSGHDFLCQGTPMTPDMLTKENGFLPLWMFLASEKLESLWGPQSVIYYSEEAGTLLQVRLGAQRAMLPTALWFHALHLAVEDKIAKTYEEEFSNRRRALQKADMTGKPVLLDDVVDAWDRAIAARRVTFAPTPGAAILPTGSGQTSR